MIQSEKIASDHEIDRTSVAIDLFVDFSFAKVVVPVVRIADMVQPRSPVQCLTSISEEYGPFPDSARPALRASVISRSKSGSVKQHLRTPLRLPQRDDVKTNTPEPGA